MTINRTSLNEREDRKSPEKDMLGVHARLENMPKGRIDDVGRNLKLREGDDRDTMIDRILDYVAWKYELTSEEKGTPALYAKLAAQENDPRISALKNQYESLPDANRTYAGNVMTWEEILNTIPDIANFLSEMDTLDNGIIYFINEEGQLVLGDGCSSPPEKTLNLSYNESRAKETRISYIDDKGDIVTVEGNDIEKIPQDAQVISQRGLITLEEAKRINEGQFETGEKSTWVESGENPELATTARYENRGYCNTCDGKRYHRGVFEGIERDPKKYTDLNNGSRSVLKINLKVDTIIREILEQRKKGNNTEYDTRGIRTRLEATLNARLNDIGTAKLKLREGDNPESIIASILEDVYKKYGLTNMSLLDEERCDDDEENDPRLSSLKKQYKNLPRSKKLYDGKIRRWEEILAAIPNIDNFLSGLDTLEDGIIYFINEEGQLVLGDRCAEPPEETLELSYNKSRAKETRISYIDDKGDIVTVEGDDIEKIPQDVQVISQRGLITLEEEKRINKGQFEAGGKGTWVEDGERTNITADIAYWDNECKRVKRSCEIRSAKFSEIGSRRVLRINLNFNS